MTKSESTARQLLLIREFFHDAERIARQETDYAAVRCVLLFDLSLELTLNALVLDAPSRAPEDDRSRKGRNFDQLWQLATTSFKEKTGERRLPNRDAAEALRELRNPAQHNGTVPHIGEVRRLTPRIQELLEAIFSKFYGTSFERFSLVGLLRHEPTRRFMHEVHELRQSAQPWAAFVACCGLYDLVILTIRGTGPRRSGRAGEVRQRVNEALHSHTGGLTSRPDDLVLKVIKEALEPLIDETDGLRNEVITSDLGIRVADTRRFASARDAHIKFLWSLDGRWQWSPQVRSAGPSRDDIDFAYDHVTRLLYFAEDAFPAQMSALSPPRFPPSNEGGTPAGWA
jgi:hypothetical protein